MKARLMILLLVVGLGITPLITIGLPTWIPLLFLVAALILLFKKE